MRTTLILLTCLFLFTAATFIIQAPQGDPWDPDAGYIPSYTSDGVVTASSNGAVAPAVVDNDPETHWQSDAPLPEGFIDRKDQNTLLGVVPQMLNGTVTTSAEKFTDGDLASAAVVSNIHGDRELAFALPNGTGLFAISIKGRTSYPLEIIAEIRKGVQISLGYYQPGDSYSLKRINTPIKKAERIILRTESDLELFEVAVLSGPPKESIVVDFREVRQVGWIESRHWAGDNVASRSDLYLSENGINWKHVGQLDPSATHPVITNLTSAMPARYLKLEHTLIPEDWNKVFIWEMKAYNSAGPYGEMPVAGKSLTTIRELIGVNGYWSWGTDRYSDELGESAGPGLYAAVASHARNYHDMTWDLKNPGDPVDFSTMKDSGTPAKDWLNWDREYGSWLQEGMNVQASLQFYRFKPEDWKNPERDAYRYAKSFTEHFGSGNGNGLVCTIEAGNEPWSYPAAVYREILLGTAKGAAAGDATVEVFPCALQAVDPSAEETGIFKNYIGARITPEAADLLDGINIHAYSYFTNANGKRRAVFPEHPNSTFWEILNARRWRDHNMPGKKIYLSEWGWDSNGGDEDCTHDECVSEQAAASYAIRGAMIAARLGIERATWFFYANVKGPSSLYTRSGLTGSAGQDFQKKQSFFALQSLVEHAGTSYFLDVVREDEMAWVYLLGSKTGEPQFLIAWRPVEGDEEAMKEVQIKGDFTFGKAWTLDGSSSNGRELMASEYLDGAKRLKLNGIPLLVEVVR